MSMDRFRQLRKAGEPFHDAINAAFDTKVVPGMYVWVDTIAGPAVVIGIGGGTVRYRYEAIKQFGAKRTIWVAGAAATKDVQWHAPADATSVDVLHMKGAYGS